MIFDRAKFYGSELHAKFRQCGVLFNRLDKMHKWAVLLAVVMVLFFGWRFLLQNMLASRLERSRAKVENLWSDKDIISKQIARFKQLEAENKLVSASEYRNKMSGRTTISIGLGQWGEQYGLRLNSSKQEGDTISLEFEGSYPATMKLFEQLANEADGLIVFQDFEYRALNEHSAASIKLQVVLGR